MKKSSKIEKLIAILVLVVVAASAAVILVGRSAGDYMGRWLYKYTYLDGDKLYYTEEDGMEQYVELTPNCRYAYSDYTGDSVDRGWWIRKDGGICLLGQDETLYLQQDDTLKTNLKDGGKMMMPDDYYNVLVRK